MRKELILKTILVLIMGIVLFAHPVNVFATDAADINSYWDDWEDQGSAGDLKQEEQTPTPTPSTQEPTTQQSTTQQSTTQQSTTQQSTTQQSTKQELPDAGLAEDTIMVVSVVALIGIAAIAFQKINEYNNI